MYVGDDENGEEPGDGDGDGDEDAELCTKIATTNVAVKDLQIRFMKCAPEETLCKLWRRA